MADFEPADVFGRLIFEWLAEISDAGLELIALVFLLTGPPLAGSTDRDVPGVGTFAYCGTPVMMHAPEVIAQLGH